MKNFLDKISPEWSLRFGLGAMYLYSGIDILRHPTAWFWAVRPLFRYFPLSMQAQFTRPDFMKGFLMTQGWIELLFAFILIGWFLPKRVAMWVAGLTALEMAGILLIIPVDAVTFRDIGLLGGALALFLLLRNSNQEVGAKEKPPVQQRPEGSGPVVETFEQFIGQQKK